MKTSDLDNSKNTKMRNQLIHYPATAFNNIPQAPEKLKVLVEFLDNTKKGTLEFRAYDSERAWNYHRERIEEDLIVKGWVKFDGCINFEFNNDALHSCEFFDSFIEKMNQINQLIKKKHETLNYF